MTLLACLADKLWNDMCRKGPEQLCFLKLPSITNPYALIMLVARAGSSNMGGSNPGDNFPDYKDVRQILLCFTGKVPCHSQIYFWYSWIHFMFSSFRWSEPVRLSASKRSRYPGERGPYSRYHICSNVQSAESIINLLLPQCDYDCFRCTRRQIGGVRVECTPVDVW